jgi:DNA-binding transcriptional MerR regulator
MMDKNVFPEGLTPHHEVLSIGDMAKIYGVTLRALRFYEDRGLLQPIREGTSRLYDAHARQRLVLILKGKQLGFTLSEIGELIANQADSLSDPDLPLDEGQIAAQLELLQRQRDELERAISELKERRRQLGSSFLPPQSAPDGMSSPG